MYINIARDFSPRLEYLKKEDGKFSAESLRVDYIEPALKKCIAINDRLTINFDNIEGYSINYLKEVFVGLIKDGYGPNVFRYLNIVSYEEPIIENIIKVMMEECYEKDKGKRKIKHT